MKKSIITGVVLSGLVFVLIGCTTVPVTTFNGNPRDSKDVATLTYNMPTFNFALPLSIYKVDGNTTTNDQTNGAIYTYVRTRGNIFNIYDNGNMNLQLLPGKHDLEVILYEPEKIKKVTYDFKAGGSYEFLLDDGKLVLMENIGDKEAAVNCEITDIPAYKEPGENEPHAILIQHKIQSGNKSKVYVKIYRIDGLAGDYYSGYTLNPGCFRNDMIRIKPGMHTVEYRGSVGNKHMLYINSQIFNFVAGKKYYLNIIDITDKVKELEDYKDSVGIMRAEVVEVK